jgi:hypothetical protein
VQNLGHFTSIRYVLGKILKKEKKKKFNLVLNQKMNVSEGGNRTCEDSTRAVQSEIIL